MELPATSSIVLGLTEDGLPQLSSESTEGVTSFLGFDPGQTRLVEVHRFPAPADLGIQRTRSLKERIHLAETVYHPGVATVIESGVDAEDHSYVVTEYVDGEPLLTYLMRTGTIPRNLGIHLALQLAETVGFLADYPRLLATINPGDFAVTLERGRQLRLRLTELGLGRDDLPVSDSRLGAYWIEIVGLFLEHFLTGRPLPSADGFAVIDPGRHELGGPLGGLIHRLRDEPGSVAIRELRNLKSGLLEAAGFSTSDSDRPNFEFHSIGEVALRPSSPLALLVGDSAELADLTRNRWRPRNDPYPGDGYSPFVLRCRAQRDPSASLEERGELYDLMILPPERLLGNAMTPRLNHQMGHAFLREHPCLVRTRSIVCDGEFTLVAGQGGNGFTLMEWVSAREQFNAEDAAFLLEEINRVLAHLGGADLGLEQLDPWRILFHFDAALPADTIRQLARFTSPAQWPAMFTRLRPVPAFDSLVDPAAGSWRHLLGRLGGKSLPTLILWAMEGHRFDQLLSAGRAHGAPLSTQPELDALFEKTAAYLDPADPIHRSRFLELFRQAISVAEDSGESGPKGSRYRGVEAGEPDVADVPKKRGWPFSRPLSAA